MANTFYEACMARAIALAKTAQHNYPNPKVGAVLTIGDQIVAEGYHHGPGQPHAEIECLRQAKKLGIDVTEATLFVTLEPCTHFGKTPPCTDAIIAAGIKNVVVGSFDPNPVAQGGAAYLRSRGLNVVTNVLEDPCRDLIADFRTWQTKQRPYITLKLAATMDGRIATRAGHSQWISSPKSRDDVHRLRAYIGQERGAILIGGQTFRLDNPLLTSRAPDVQKQPYAFVLTSHLPNPQGNWHLIKERPQQTFFLTLPENLDLPLSKELAAHKVRLFPLPIQNHEIDFKQLAQDLLFQLGVSQILCEGGGQLGLSLLTNGVVDEFILYLAPIMLGDNLARPLLTGLAPLKLEEGLGFKIYSTEMIGGDLKITLRPKE